MTLPDPATMRRDVAAVFIAVTGMMQLMRCMVWFLLAGRADANFLTLAAASHLFTVRLPTLSAIFGSDNLVAMSNWLARCDASYGNVTCSFSFVWITHAVMLLVLAVGSQFYAEHIGKRTGYPG